VAEAAPTNALRALPASRIVAHIADAAARWCDADFPPRVRVTAQIEARLGYTIPVIDYALDTLFGAITERALGGAIASELGSVGALDGVRVRQDAPSAWPRGVERSVVVSSDTTIGVALVPALFALCAKSRVVVKDRTDALVGAFFATLAEEHPAFATAVDAAAWTGGADPAEAALFADAQVVVAFGGDDALRAIRERCGVDTRFVGFGHRVSIGRLSADGAREIDTARAEELVRDALLYDGEGCLSLHLVFVSAHGAALERVIAVLARACERVAVEFPAGRPSAARASGAAAYRSLARFRAANDAALVADAGGPMVLVLTPDEPPPLVPRVVAVVPITSDEDVVAYVRAHRLPVQALGVDRVDPTAVALAEQVGAVRVCLFGAMQDPPVAGHHGGEGRILPFIRWIDAE
jgi:hypothetical protein